jgi:hypothetical protein
LKVTRDTILRAAAPDGFYFSSIGLHFLSRERFQLVGFLRKHCAHTPPVSGQQHELPPVVLIPIHVVLGEFLEIAYLVLCLSVHRLAFASASGGFLRYGLHVLEYLFGDKYPFSIRPNQQRARSDFCLISYVVN